MSISPTLNDLSKLALVASDASYFTTSFPVAHAREKGVGSLYVEVLSRVRDGRSHLSRRGNAGVDPASRNTAAQRLLYTVASALACTSAASFSGFFDSPERST